ncbi:hypothetical protein M3Y94_00173700 [Aphelenchoides besseyi]|nr:hypothetical protein M3Y94_00173700 [Aphelenchoides besseyi]KAI6236950.1 hypothetical protein M3Y95_00213500 [Aphelenchoides besseyi]
MIRNVLFVLALATAVSAYYLQVQQPIVTSGAIRTCNCGFIKPNAQCDNVFHNTALPCPGLQLTYTANPYFYTQCDKVYITCTNRGVAGKSAGILAKIIDKTDYKQDWSLISDRTNTAARLTLQCGSNGKWIMEDLEGNSIVHPLEIQCMADDGESSLFL